MKLSDVVDEILYGDEEQRKKIHMHDMMKEMAKTEHVNSVMMTSLNISYESRK